MSYKSSAAGRIGSLLILPDLFDDFQLSEQVQSARWRQVLARCRLTLSSLAQTFLGTLASIVRARLVKLVIQRLLMVVVKRVVVSVQVINTAGGRVVVDVARDATGAQIATGIVGATCLAAGRWIRSDRNDAFFFFRLAHSRTG